MDLSGHHRPERVLHRTKLQDHPKHAWVAMDDSASERGEPEYIVNYLDTCNDGTMPTTGFFSGIVDQDGAVIAGNAECLKSRAGMEGAIPPQHLGCEAREQGVVQGRRKLGGHYHNAGLGV